MKCILSVIVAGGLALGAAACSSGPDLPDLPSIPDPLGLFSGSSSSSNSTSAGSRWSDSDRSSRVPPPAPNYREPRRNAEPDYTPPPAPGSRGGNTGFGDPDGDDAGSSGPDPFASDPYSSLEPAGGSGGDSCGGGACGAGGKACG